MPLALTQDQIDFFNTQGYLVVEDVLPAATLSALRTEYAALLNELYTGWQAQGLVPPASDFFDQLLTAYKAGLEWFQPLDISLPGDKITADVPLHTGPAVFGMMTAPRLLDVIEDLIGPEITSVPIQHVRMKPPAPDVRPGETRSFITATDWHQDRGVGHEVADATQMVTCWLAITDATTENGCLKVLPGKPDMLPHCPQTQVGIPSHLIDEEGAVPLPVRAGGAVLFHPLTPHASLVNRSEGFRWSFDIRYCVTGQPTGRAHFPDFVARSRAAPETELRDWRLWSDMWLEARARLSGAPHIPIHRWRADNPVCA